MTDAARAPATILVVEDDAVQRGALARLLERAGYRVVQAGGAYEALRRVLRVRPDLAIVDVVLPDSTGMEVTRALHAIAGTAEVPVVVVTAFAGAPQSVEPRSFGAAGLLVKPVPERELLETVARCLAQSPAGAPPSPTRQPAAG